MSDYFRPIPNTDAAIPEGALRLAGGWTWFSHAERFSRKGAAQVVAASDVPANWRDRLTAPRPAIAGLAMDAPRLMGIVNVTPDSFSDGGDFAETDAAVAQGRALAEAGADILDIGGESTRPFAEEIAPESEIARVVPVIAALAGAATPVSVDTRKAKVARASVDAGARFVNDVSALRHDPQMAHYVAGAGLPICLMHMQGTPGTMALDPRYDNVLLDVYDELAERVAAAEAAGIQRSCIVVDPGIGFGKTAEHNLVLLRNLSLFHGLGCPILLGVSRKRFIDAVAQVPEAKDRLPGSLAVALAGVAQGVQILRVHDISETRQALSLYRAVTGKGA